VNQLTSATAEFVFAPEERDVYCYERTLKDLDPVGAKLGSVNFARAEAIGSYVVRSNEKPLGYKHLAPLGQSDKQSSVALQT
jgi:hypothetical protein